MKVKRILLLLVIAMFLCTPYVFAAEPQISIEGDATAKLGETKDLIVKISSETEIGIVTGTIEKSDNISNITVTAKNNWNLTYNKDTGIFNIFKAEGAREEEIMNIQYTTSNVASSEYITISDIEINTIEYETTNVERLTKEITIEEEQTPIAPGLSSIQIVQAPTKTTYKEGEIFDPTGMRVEAVYTDGTTTEITGYTYNPNGNLSITDDKIIISYTEGDITKTVEQEITVESEVPNPNPDPLPEQDEDPSKLEGEIPKAGATHYILVAITSLLIIAYVMYRLYDKHRGI